MGARLEAHKYPSETTIMLKNHDFFRFQRILQPPRSIWRAPHARQRTGFEKQIWIAPSNIKFEAKLADLRLLERAQKNGKLHDFRCDLTSPEKKLVDLVNKSDLENFWKTSSRFWKIFGKSFLENFWKINLENGQVVHRLTENSKISSSEPI